MTPEEHPDELAVRELLARAVDGVEEIDLAPSALAGARARRRRRAAVGVGSAVAAAALVTALAINGLGGSAGPVDPAASTSTSEETRPAREALEANQRLVDAIGSSGIAVDYQPLVSPYEAMEAPLVVVGDIRSVRLEGGDAGPEVRMVVDVTRHLAGAEEPAAVEASFSVGGRFGLSQGDLDAVRGPVLLVIGNLVPDDGGVPRAYPFVDGAWFDVPTGIDGPYVDYADLEGYWPPAEDAEELADALSSLPAPGSDLPDPSDPQAFARAEEIAVAMEQETRVDTAACQARLLRTEGEGADQVARARVRCTGVAPEGTDAGEIRTVGLDVAEP